MLRLKFIILLIVFLGFSSITTGEIPSCNKMLSSIEIAYMIDKNINPDMLVRIIDSLDPFYEKGKVLYFFTTIIISNDKFQKFTTESKIISCLDSIKTEFVIYIDFYSKGTLIESIELSSYEQISEYIKMNTEIFGDLEAIPDKFLKRFKKIQETKIKK